MTTYAIQHAAGNVGNGLTPREILSQRNLVEYLVCAISRRYQEHFGDLPDELLGEHNADVMKAWKALDRLSLWAGGLPAWGDDREIRRTDHRRAAVAGACNRLYGLVEPGARVVQVAITVHTADGTEVSYHTATDEPAVMTVVHMPDHEGCTVIGDGPEDQEGASDGV